MAFHIKPTPEAGVWGWVRFRYAAHGRGAPACRVTSPVRETSYPRLLPPSPLRGGDLGEGRLGYAARGREQRRSALSPPVRRRSSGRDRSFGHRPAAIGRRTHFACSGERIFGNPSARNGRPKIPAKATCGWFWWHLLTPKGAWLKAGGLLKVGMTRKKNWEWRIENLGITAIRRLWLSTAGKAFHIKPPPRRGGLRVVDLNTTPRAASDGGCRHSNAL